jgi:hypothetical protein
MQENIKKNLRRLILSSIDMEQAIEFSKYLLQNGPWSVTNKDARTLSRALQTAMIVAYVRPFSGNHGKSHTQGSLNLDLANRFNQEERTLHQRMIDLRHKVFAHTDSEVRDLRVSVEDFLGEPMALPTSHNPFVLMETHEIQAFNNLATKLQALITEEITSLQITLIPGEHF